MNEYARRIKKDPLTGLINKEGAFAAIQRSIQEYPLGTHSMLMLNLDNFKRINSVYGEPVGDTVLKEVSRLLSATFRQQDIISRLDSDEFLIFMPNIDSRMSVENIANTIIISIRTIIGQSYPAAELTASIGIVFTDENPDLRNIFESVYRALYVSKQHGRNRYSVM